MERLINGSGSLVRDSGEGSRGGDERERGERSEREREREREG